MYLLTTRVSLFILSLLAALALAALIAKLKLKDKQVIYLGYLLNVDI